MGEVTEAMESVTVRAVAGFSAFRKGQKNEKDKIFCGTARNKAH